MTSTDSRHGFGTEGSCSPRVNAELLKVASLSPVTVEAATTLLYCTGPVCCAETTARNQNHQEAGSTSTMPNMGAAFLATGAPRHRAGSSVIDLSYSANVSRPLQPKTGGTVIGAP